MKYAWALTPLATTAALPMAARQFGDFLGCGIDPALSLPCFLGELNIGPLLSTLCWYTTTALHLGILS